MFPAGIDNRPQTAAEPLEPGFKCEGQRWPDRRILSPFKPDPRYIWHLQILHLVWAPAVRAPGLRPSRECFGLINKLRPNGVQPDRDLVTPAMFHCEVANFALRSRRRPTIIADEVGVVQGMAQWLDRT